MCIAQSGQCYSSGILFGSSSNRGKCMKPCRWPYELVDMKTGTPLEVKMEGPYLLAAKDMCLLQFIPELIDAGVASFKIEGRMRPPEFMAQVVRIYRTALDQYLKDPIGYVNDPDLFEELYQQRVRDFSTCFTFKKPDGGLITSSGKREPLFLSTGVKEHEVDLLNPVEGLFFENSIADVNDPPVLAVHVGGPDAAEEALAHGADWIYIGGEISPVRRQQWPLTDMLRIIRKAHTLGKKVGVLLPRVTFSSQIKEIAWFLERVDTLRPDAILVHNLGTLRMAGSLSDISVHADFSFNSLNRRSIELLKGLGAARVTLSLESSFQVVTALAKDAGLPLECMVHGPVTGMYLEHCIMSLALKGTSSQDPCRGACRYLQSGLKNKLGDVYPVEPDQYCRNHILLSKDLACISYLDFFQKAGVQSLRIEAQYYEKELVGLLTELYAGAIKQNHSDNSYRELLRRVLAQSPRGFSLGAYPKGIFKKAGRIVKGHMSAA
jgi:putative protease